jgi:Putative motility protein
MDLTASLVNLKQSRLMAQVQVSVARKVLDVQQLQGAAAIKLIQAATTGVTRAGDALTAAATGLGGLVDTTA